MILLNEGHALVASPLSANMRMRRLPYSPAASVPVTGSTGDASSVICPSVPSHATPCPVTGEGGGQVRREPVIVFVPVHVRADGIGLQVEQRVALRRRRGLLVGRGPDDMVQREADNARFVAHFG